MFDLVKRLMPLMEEDGAGGAAGGADPEPTDDNKDGTDTTKDGAKYTDKDVDDIIAKRYARWQKDQEKAIADARAEAEKLAKMNSDQKKDYELEKEKAKATELEKEIAQLKSEAQRAELAKTASGILKSEYNIDASSELLNFIVADDAEKTKENIESFAAIVDAQVKAREIERNTGTTPRRYSGSDEELTEFQKRMAKYKSKY